MQTEMHRIDATGKGHSIFDFEGNRGAEVIKQILSHSGKLVNERYLEFLKLVLGADPR